LDGSHPADLPKVEWIIAVGRGENSEAATKAARLVLLEKLWGPLASRSQVELPTVYLPGRDVLREWPFADGTMAILIAVEHSMFKARVQVWMQDPPASETTDANTPRGQLAGVLAYLGYLDMQAYGCRRLVAVIDDDCELPDTTVARRQIIDIARRLSLKSAFEGGIPYRAGDALRPAAVMAQWKSSGGSVMPWVGLPLIFGAPPGTLMKSTEVTDARGYADAVFVEVPSVTLRITVQVDAKKLLGHYAELWPTGKIALRFREIKLASDRIGVHLHELIVGKIDRAGAATSSVAKELRRAGYKRAHALPDQSAAQLDEARGGDMAAMVREIASFTGGTVDVVVVGDARSDFASRMGAQSVWHEADASVRVYDAWSGEQIGVVERSAQALGIGDYNAAHKALKKLGELIASGVHELLERQGRGS